MLTVSLVEDDLRYRDHVVAGLRAAGGIAVGHVAASGEEALEQFANEAPSVVLMDLQLPGMSGAETVARLRARWPEALCVMLTTFDGSDEVFASLQAGAVGYLVKTAGPQEIVAAVREVATGGSPMSPAIARKVVRYFAAARPATLTPASPVDASGRLSEREQAVIEGLAKGLLYKEIASQLNVSEETVRTYVRRTYTKLEVSSRTEAVAKWVRSGEHSARAGRAGRL